MPTSTGVPRFTPCNVPGGTPADQWSPVRDAWKQAHPTAKVSPGRNLGFPFTGSTLLNDLPGEIRKLVKVCE